MTLLTVDEFRGFVSTSLGDDEVQLLLDAAEAEITAFAGPVGSITELVDGGYGTLIVSRLVDSIASITELVGTTTTTLAADDYRTRGGYVIERLDTGTNRRRDWNGLVTVTYTAQDDTDIRKAVQLDLVRLDLDSDPGITSETIGSWTEQRSPTQTQARADVLARLRPDPQMVPL